MITCPCCSHSMLRHIQNQQVYWFCRNCWQDMPPITTKKDLCFSNQIRELKTSKVNPKFATV
ncbi:MAG: hypothetical protein AAF349_28415 [Cyanobacteria bacterium P01_A01_bin.68]